MLRSLGILCAGALLISAAGCTLDSFFLSFSGSSNRQEQIATMSVDQTAAVLQAKMHSFNITLASSRIGEEIHLKGLTKSGKSFEFILQRQKSDTGDRTIVAFEGDKETELLVVAAAFEAVKKGPQPQQDTNVVPSASSGGVSIQPVQGGAH